MVGCCVGSAGRHLSATKAKKVMTCTNVTKELCHKNGQIQLTAKIVVAVRIGTIIFQQQWDC